MNLSKKIISLISLSFLLVFSSCTPTSPSMTDADTQTQPESVTSSVTDIQTISPIQTEAETQKPEPVIKKISFIGMGDNLIHSPIFKQSHLGGDEYDFLPKYADVADMIKRADIAFINQETPMCGSEYGYHNYPQFNTPQQMGRDLVTLGFDVISFANNHMNDQGSVAFEKMIDFTDTLDAMTVGLYRDEDDYDNIRVLEKDGVRIAFLAYTYGINIRQSSSATAVIPIYNDEVLTKHITYAKDISDIVIVSMHWGNENKYTVTESQEETAQLIADLGADVILGHHPHVVQKVEWLTGESGNSTLCYYSLGNGINNQDYLKNMVGVTASFDIVSVDGDCHIENASVIPTFCYQTKSYKNTALYLLENLTDKMADAHHCNYKGDTVTVEAAREIITDTIDAEFLPDYLLK